MPFIEDKRAIAEGLETVVGARLMQAVEHGAEYARQIVPVKTGALRSTIRAVGPVMKRDSIEAALIAGGVAENGAEVDYMLENEVRNPFMVPSIEAIAEGFSEANQNV